LGSQIYNAVTHRGVGGFRRRWGVVGLLMLASGLLVGPAAATSARLQSPSLRPRAGDAATSAPPSNTAPPTISGTAQDGQSLTASPGTWSSPDPLAYRYQWQRCDSTGANCANINAATASSYTLTSGDVGHQVTVVVSAIDTNTNQRASASAAPQGPVAAPPPPSNTSLPTLSGTVQDGQTLTAGKGSWSSPDALTYAYQWQRCDSSGASCTNVTGATTSSYRLSSLDVGHQVTVMVSATDKENQTAQATAAPVGPVAAPPPPANTTLPVISGWAQDGQTLFVANGSWSSLDALTYAYQWRRCDSSGANCVDIPGANSQTYTLGSVDDGNEITAAVSATDNENQTTQAAAAPVGPVTNGPLTGIHKIQHVVIIMQENRSFDSYFGTFPGAAGIPSGVCVPDPLNGGCVQSYHDPLDQNLGGPHGSPNAAADVDNGQMDGFVGQVERAMGCPASKTDCTPCTQPTQTACIDAMGYHDSSEIPNYWAYASDFVLQDHMFASEASWSLPEHLAMVSEWSARCGNPQDPSTCVNNLDNPTLDASSTTTPNNGALVYAWTDLTHLLYEHNISWGYYIFQGSEPDCEVDSQMSCASVSQKAKTQGIWNPLPSFTDVSQDGQLGNVQTLSNFFAAAQSGTLPAVSWINPNQTVSEHPQALVSKGQTYVTGLINAIMQSPDWNSTAIFLSWDEWGGFYDHVVPPKADLNGYGLRVPGIVISPYAKQGYIDNQTLSHDAYIKFIEDDFLGGERLDPKTDGRPDPRPSVREANPILGDLTADFDFTQDPRPPEILPVCPQTDLVPTPQC
jgi:phospholipase C